MWELDTTALDAAAKAGGSGIAPFMEMIEGGAGGERVDEMRDFFYYSQLRSQGEETTADRRITGRVAPEALPDLLRALGSYPSEFEARDLLNEVRCMKRGADDGVTFDEAVKLYINHRPVVGVDRQDMVDAFAVLGSQPGTGLLKTEVVLRELQRTGEPLSDAELSRCISTLAALMEGGGELGLPSELTAEDFAEKVLGFETAGAEEDEALAEAEAALGAAGASGGAGAAGEEEEEGAGDA